MKNYFNAILEEDENLFSHEDLCSWEDKRTSFYMGYDFSVNEDSYIEMMRDMEGKKEFYLIIEGVNNVCYDGFHVKQFRVVDSFQDLQECIVDKSALLCHIWYFNYNKVELKKIFGNFDSHDRIYPKKIDGKIFAYDLYDKYWGMEFDTIEEFKEYLNSFKYKEFLKPYDSYDELLKSYN